MTTNTQNASNVGASGGNARPHLDESVLACSMLVKRWIDQATTEECELIEEVTQVFEDTNLLRRLQRRISRALGYAGESKENKSPTNELKRDGTEHKTQHKTDTVSPKSEGEPLSSGVAPSESPSSSERKNLSTQQQHHQQPQQQQQRTNEDRPKPTLDAIHAWNEHFDIDLYLKPEYDVEVPAVPLVNSILTLFQRPKRAVLPPADVDNIFYYIRRLFARLRLAPESVITMLVYLERLQRVTPARLTERTWIPLVTASLMAASKVWDDFNIFNVELAEALPFFGLEQLALLERRFVVGLQYALGVTTAEYSKQYYCIRDMVTQNNQRLSYLQERVREHIETQQQQQMQQQMQQQQQARRRRLGTAANGSNAVNAANAGNVTSGTSLVGTTNGTAQSLSNNPNYHDDTQADHQSSNKFTSEISQFSRPNQGLDLASVGYMNGGDTGQYRPPAMS